MGTEKALLVYRNKPMVEELTDLLAHFCKEIWVSCHAENKKLFSHQNVVIDAPKFANSGPIGGLLSAHEQLPGALFVLGCDYPLLELSDLDFLLKHRNETKFATVFQNPETHKPEPLLGIYEEHCFPALIKWFEEGNTSLRIFLEHNNVQMVSPPAPKHLLSADTPEMYQKLKTKK